jgi:hypothetical protein
MITLKNKTGGKLRLVLQITTTTYFHSQAARDYVIRTLYPANKTPIKNWPTSGWQVDEVYPWLMAGIVIPAKPARVLNQFSSFEDAESSCLVSSAVTYFTSLRNTSFG